MCEAQSGKAHDLDIPAACSVRELRDAMRRAADGDLADVPGAQATATPPHPGARFELLCIDEASDDAPVRLDVRRAKCGVGRGQVDVSDFVAADGPSALLDVMVEVSVRV